MRRITKHFGQRNDRLDYLRSGAMLHAFNASASRTQIAHDHAGIILRRDDLDCHYRLQEHRRSLPSGLFERHRTSNFERHFVRVDIVITAVEQRRLDIDHRITGQHSAFERFLNALVDRFDEFLRYRPANDLVDEFVPGPRWLRIEINLRVSVLTATTGLPDVLAFRFGVSADRLA